MNVGPSIPDIIIAAFKSGYCDFSPVTTITLPDTADTGIYSPPSLLNSIAKVMPFS